jgi:hypothetical protein
MKFEINNQKNKYENKLKSMSYHSSKSEYRYMLEKCMSHYYSSKIKKKIRQIKFWGLGFATSYLIFSIIKYSLVLYYYIMWEVDIRKPKVSDYIIERYR